MVSCAWRSKRWSIKGKEFDTYKVGTVANSCSTMHKIDAYPITREMFSWDNEAEMDSEFWVTVDRIIAECERLRQLYKKTGDKKWWRALIQILPESWMQKRTVTLNYQVARAQRFARKGHKLTEWHTLCDAYENLPYGKEFICYEKPKKISALLAYVFDKLDISYADEFGAILEEKKIWENIIKHFEKE